MGRIKFIHILIYIIALTGCFDKDNVLIESEKSSTFDLKSAIETSEKDETLQVESNEQDYYLVLFDGLRMRTMPSLGEDIVHSLSAGALVKVLETSAEIEVIDNRQSFWYRVTTTDPNPVEGWAFGGYLEYVYTEQALEAINSSDIKPQSLEIVNQNGNNGVLRWGPDYGGYGLYMFWYSNGLCTLSSPQSGIFGTGFISTSDNKQFQLTLFPSAVDSVKQFEEDSLWQLTSAEDSLRYIDKLINTDGFILYNLDNVEEIGKVVTIQGIDITSRNIERGYLNKLTEIYTVPDGSSIGSFYWAMEKIESSILPKGWPIYILGECSSPYENYYYILIAQEEYSRGTKNAFIPKESFSSNWEERPEHYEPGPEFYREIILRYPDSYEEKVNPIPAFQVFSTLMEKEFWEKGQAWFHSQNEIEVEKFSTVLSDENYDYEVWKMGEEGEPFLFSITLINRDLSFSDSIDFSMSRDEIIDSLGLSHEGSKINNYRIGDDFISFYSQKFTVSLIFEGTELMEVLCSLNI